MNLTIRQAVRRRVWYSFMIRILTNPALIPGLCFGYSLILFKELVFVERVLESILATEVGQLPGQVLDIVANADWPTILTVLVMLVSLWLFCLLLAMPNQGRIGQWSLKV